MGGDSYSSNYLERLKVSLEQLGEEYRAANLNKNIFQVIYMIYYLFTYNLCLVCSVLERFSSCVTH